MKVSELISVLQKFAVSAPDIDVLHHVDIDNLPIQQIRLETWEGESPILVLDDEKLDDEELFDMSAPTPNGDIIMTVTVVWPKAPEL